MPPAYNLAVMKMMTYFTELKYKEVIDVHTGFRLGCVCDVEFDDCSGQIASLICPGRPRFFGLLGREDDYILPWDAITQMGSDIILIDGKADIRRQSAERGPLL